MGGSAMRYVATCPYCGCELSPEVTQYRCWCCDKSFSKSEITALTQPSPGQREATTVQPSGRHDQHHAALRFE